MGFAPPRSSSINNFISASTAPRVVKVGAELSGEIQYTSIQQAINAAAAASPTPSATAPWDVYIYPGVYSEQITMSDYVNIRGIGPRGSVIISYADPGSLDAVMTLVGTIEIENVTIRMTTPAGNSRGIVDDGGAACTAILREVNFEVTTPGSYATRTVWIRYTSTVTIESCYASVNIHSILQCSGAATIRIRFCDFSNSAATGGMLVCTAGTITCLQNAWSGAAAMFSSISGSTATIACYGDVIANTGSNVIAAGTVTVQDANGIYHVYSGMVISHAFGSSREIHIHRGTYAESDLSPSASITLIGEDPDYCIIETGDAANPIVDCAETCTIANLTISNTNASAPGLRVTANTVTVRNCIVRGTGAGDAIAMTAGTLIMYDSDKTTGDIDLSTAICTLSMYRCRITTDPIDTAGAFAHVLTLSECDFGGQNLASAATGATTLSMKGCIHAGTVSNAGTGAFTIRDSQIATVTQSDATGSIAVTGGDIGACGGSTGTVTWIIGVTYHVITGMTIGHAIGASREVVVHRGTYSEQITMLANCTLKGEIKTDVIISVTGGQTAITAAAACRIENLSISVTADGSGSATGIICNNVSLVIDDVNISLSRTANVAVAISEQTNTTAATIRLRNVRIVGTDASCTGIYVNQSGKSLIIENSHVECSTRGIEISGVTVNITSIGNYYWASTQDASIGGGTLSFNGDTFAGSATANIGVAAGSATFNNCHIQNRLDNDSTGTVTLNNCHCPTIRLTAAGLVNVNNPNGITERYIYRAHNSALFDAVGLTDSEVVFTQPADSILLGAMIELMTQFAAVGLTDLDVTLGDAGDNDGILVQAMNLFSDAVNSQYKDRGAYWSAATNAGYYVNAATSWTAYATAVGANLSTTSAGGIMLKFVYMQL